MQVDLIVTVVPAMTAPDGQQLHLGMLASLHRSLPILGYALPNLSGAIKPDSSLEWDYFKDL